VNYQLHFNYQSINIFEAVPEPVLIDDDDDYDWNSLHVVNTLGGANAEFDLFNFGTLKFI
jgi:hypothetical protein